ncbi:hypothetical protein Csa_016011 [Cucumis sativus]|uniref:hAT-like transposase RNase-H fold domain-containing protein n=1 Tax=Cucumis sativus TaxID=3659 RepID=A0A0A0K403_CUCSA|nr:hypothetical protein Csa_016011 [Cucumis sativus]
MLERYRYEKYWSVIHGVLAIATVLDPRFKMRLIEFYFRQIYGSHYIVEIERVRELCCDLMKVYSSKSSIIEEPPSTSYSTSKRDGSSSKTSLANKHTPMDAKVLENVFHDQDIDDDEPFPTKLDEIR